MSKSIPKVSVAIDPRQLYEFVTLVGELLYEAEQAASQEDNHGPQWRRAATLRQLRGALEKPLLRTLMRGAKASREAGHDAAR